MGSPSDLPDLLDRAVIAWILAGNVEARHELEGRYWDRVYRRIRRRIREPGIAHELAHATFEKAFEKLHTFKLERPFAPWIGKVAHNTVNNHLRKERRDRQAEWDWIWGSTPGKRLRLGVPAIDADPSDPPIDLERFRQKYALAREQVNRTQLQCFELHERERLAFAKIARKLHIKTAVARSYASRAQERLVQLMGKLSDFLLTDITPG